MENRRMFLERMRKQLDSINETLSLGTESLRELSSHELASVAGGGDPIQVARLWGNGSKENGFSWADPDALRSPDYRERAGLPNVNSGERITYGYVNPDNII